MWSGRSAGRSDGILDTPAARRRDINRRRGERIAVALQETGVKFAEEDDA